MKSDPDFVKMQRTLRDQRYRAPSVETHFQKTQKELANDRRIHALATDPFLNEKCARCSCLKKDHNERGACRKFDGCVQFQSLGQTDLFNSAFQVQEIEQEVKIIERTEELKELGNISRVDIMTKNLSAVEGRARLILGYLLATGKPAGFAEIQKALGETEHSKEMSIIRALKFGTEKGWFGKVDKTYSVLGVKALESN